MTEINSPTLLFDIMMGDTYKGQLKYYGHGKPDLIDGKIIEVFDSEELKQFIEEKRPSLKGKDYRIEFSNQKVI
jgi:hypothetical protein